MNSKAQMVKAQKLVDLSRVRKKNKTPNAWYVLPIPGYNSTRYTVSKNGGRYMCDCQFNRTTHEACSHIYAVFKYSNK